MRHTTDPPAPLFDQPKPKGPNYREMAKVLCPDVAAKLNTPGPTLDAARAKAERDGAVQKAAERVELDWLRAAQAAIVECANSMETFIVDDVQAKLAAAGIPPPREGRAMGAAISWAVRNRVIESTGQYRASSQVQCHANPRTVWRKKTGASA
mgnify:CR=1 FL=1